MYSSWIELPASTYWELKRFISNWKGAGVRSKNLAVPPLWEFQRQSAGVLEVLS